MKKKKILISLCLIMVVYLVIALSFAIISFAINRNKLQKLEDKEYEHLANINLCKNKVYAHLLDAYNEAFINVEFLAKIQNEQAFGLDGTVFFKNKIKDSYKYYYKAYSVQNDIEFYAYCDVTENERAFKVTNLTDTYMTFLNIRKDATKISDEIDKIFSDLAEISCVSKYGLEYETKNLAEALSTVSGERKEFADSPYFQKTAVVGTGLHYNINMNFNDLCNKEYYDKFNELYEFIKITNEKRHAKPIEVHFECLDGHNITFYLMDNPYGGAIVDGDRDKRFEDYIKENR